METAILEQERGATPQPTISTTKAKKQRNRQQSVLATVASNNSNNQETQETEQQDQDNPETTEDTQEASTSNNNEETESKRKGKQRRLRGKQKDEKHLTAREKEVVSGIANGLTAQEVSEKMDISRRTVEAHRARIMLKLNIHTLAGLVKYAIRNGLTSVDE